MVDAKKRGKKEMSKERTQALNAVKNAKSEQEKKVAKQQLKFVRFKEVGALRVDRAITAMRNLEKVCDGGSYAWTNEQADKIIKTLEPISSRIVNALRNPGTSKKQREKFSF